MIETTSGLSQESQFIVEDNIKVHVILHSSLFLIVSEVRDFFLKNLLAGFVGAAPR